jgi:hypothetical protein
MLVVLPAHFSSCLRTYVSLIQGIGGGQATLSAFVEIFRHLNEIGSRFVWRSQFQREGVAFALLRR